MPPTSAGAHFPDTITTRKRNHHRRPPAATPWARGGAASALPCASPAAARWAAARRRHTGPRGCSRSASAALRRPPRIDGGDELCLRLSFPVPRILLTPQSQQHLLVT